jgi:phosphoglycolate phosphatase-like HAD superfamily hydrolase
VSFASAKKTEVSAPVVIFDVEGTLVDCIGQTLESWRETLADFGLNFSIVQLHPLSGMDSGEMLDALLAESKAIDLKREILKEQGERYRDKFLPKVTPFPGVKSLFRRPHELGWRLGLATTCQPDELSRYSSLVGNFDLVEAIACGADAKRGKPHPDLHRIVLQRLGADAHGVVSVGDTPYDAIAAARAGIGRIVGTLSGGFSAATLRQAGCGLVLETAVDVLGAVAQGGYRAGSK